MRLRRLFSWSAAGPVLAYLASMLVVIAVVGAFVDAHDATDARNKTAAAAARRIDKMQTEIDSLQTRLRNLSTRDAQERGRLEDAIQALVSQLREAHLEPVTTGQPQASASATSPRPRQSRSPSPKPQPSRTPTPHPSPSPSPTCVHVTPLHRSICVVRDRP